MKQKIQFIGLAAALAAFGCRAHVFHDKDNDFTQIADKLDEAGKNQIALMAENKALKEQITLQTDRWEKKHKEILDDLTMAKNRGIETQADLEAMQLKMNRTMAAASREFMSAKGANDLGRFFPAEVKSLLNAWVRGRANGLGANFRLSSDHEKALKDGGFDMAGKALSGGSSPGSLELQSQLSQSVYDLLPSYGIWSSVAVEPMSRRTNLFNVDTADPVFKVYAEGATMDDDTNITGSQLTVTAKIVGALLDVSNELLQDAEYDVTPKLMRKFARGFSKTVDYLTFMADGTDDATNGDFEGMFVAGTSKTAASGNTTVETLDFEDVTGTMLSCGEEALSRQARWWIHPFMLTRLLSVKDSNGRPIFLTAQEAPSAAGIGSILGYPVTLGNILPKTNSAGGKVMAFGDPDAMVVGLRKDLEIVTSPHAAFKSNSLSFRALGRVATKLRVATAIAYLKTAAS